MANTSVAGITYQAVCDRSHGFTRSWFGPERDNYDDAAADAESHNEQWEGHEAWVLSDNAFKSAADGAVAVLVDVSAAKGVCALAGIAGTRAHHWAYKDGELYVIRINDGWARDIYDCDAA